MGNANEHPVGLSVMMIARDASKHLDASLTALTPLADEIVFVDTGSNDDSIEIAKRHGCRVLTFAWSDDFAAARNFAIEHARYRWILSVDADEIVTTENAREVLSHAMRAREVPAYLIYQDNVFDSGDVKPNLVARLFQNHPLIRFRNPVHECISENVLEHFPAHRLAAIELHVRHVGYLAAHVAGKHARNLAILERWTRREPDNLFANFKLGNMLWEAGRTREAIFPLSRAFEQLQDTRTRANAPYLKTFIYIFHETLKAAGETSRADEFARVATEWLRP